MRAVIIDTCYWQPQGACYWPKQSGKSIRRVCRRKIAAIASRSAGECLESIVAAVTRSVIARRHYPIDPCSCAVRPRIAPRSTAEFH